MRTVCGNSDGFGVGVGVHQGSALSPLLFVVVMEALSGEFGVAWPWVLLRADGLVVVAENWMIWLEGLMGGGMIWRMEE